MGKFAGYLGKLEIEIDGEKLELDVQMQDKQKLMSSKGIKSEQGVGKMIEVFKGILKRSYPDEPVEELEAFLTRKIERFMTEISIAFGWTTREELEMTTKSFREKEAEQV